jgi:hypothetical protein
LLTVDLVILGVRFGGRGIEGGGVLR